GESPTAAPAPRLPRAPTAEIPRGIPADTLSTRIAAFLRARGYPAAPDAPESGSSPPRQAPEAATRRSESSAAAGPAPAPGTARPAEFVCEEDVRQAIRAGRKIVIGEKTIVTPAARDLGEAHKVFVPVGPL
ncbi:MAG TPA: hypothetical protein VNI83_14375, partial [Vicinamibacterales bacterium]|nr:hypothetical protein [Vicinamibacterales bacterium]